MTVDRLIPSVENAARWMRRAADVAEYPCVFNDGESCPMCADEWQAVENAALAYDLAVSVGRAFDRNEQQRIWQMREDDRLRSEVAW